MNRWSLMRLVPLLLGALGLYAVGAPAGAAALYSQTQVVSTGSTPVEQVFTPTTAQAGAIDVTVVDRAFPASLTSLRVAVTQGATVLQSAAATAGSPGTLKLTFTATAGVDYTIRLVGRPSAAAGAGAVVVSLTAAGTTSPTFQSFPASFKAAVTAPGPGGVLPDQAILFAAAGTYTATLTDLGVPSSMPGLTAALFNGAQFVASITPGTPTQVVIPTANTTYTLRVIAPASGAGGLFSLNISGGPSSTVVYPANGDSGITAIGTVAPPVTIANPTAGLVSLLLSDLNFPNALGTLTGVLTTASGQLVARQCVTTCGLPNVSAGTAPAGNLLLWRSAAAGAGVGGYFVSVVGTGGSLYSSPETVSVTAAAAQNSFSFPFTVPATGNYSARVTDFAAPAGLQTLQFAVFQNGVVVGTPATGAGSATVPLAAGTAQLVVVASAFSGSAGIFGAEILTTSSTPSTLFAQSQAVGTFSGTSTLTVSSALAGTYDFTLTDAHWPASFGALNLFVTQGAAIVGRLYGGGTVPVTLAAGDYVITYSAVPDATETAGLYSVNVLPTPLPTATLTVDQQSVASGQSVKLSWTSTGATGCTASGGWSGSQASSGTAVSQGPLTATTTFTLTCTGAGGTSSPASQTVTVTGGGSGGGGGGGDLGAAGLGLLGLMVAMRGLARKRAA